MPIRFISAPFFTPAPRRAALALGLALLAAAAPGAMAQTPPGAGPKQVGTLTLAPQDVPQVYTLPGRAVAQDQVAIRPRVGGIITEILFRPGAAIARGAPMFRIDPTTYDAAVMAAEANLASARAAVPQAQAAYDRAQRLLGSGTTQADFEVTQTTLAQANAAVQAATASLAQARAEQGWTTITSPLDGVASVAAVSVGDLVTAGQTDALATVTRLDPIEVDMYEPSARLQRLRDDIDSGRLKVSDSLKVELTLENGVTYSATGELVAPGYAVSTSTGSIDFRFRFANPDQRILPGMFVRGQVGIGTIRAILVPQLATARGRDGQLTAWVAEDGKAVQRSLTESGTSGSYWVVDSGLSEGDVLIVNGLTGLVPGAEVAPLPVSIDENGLILDAPTAETTASE